MRLIGMVFIAMGFATAAVASAAEPFVVPGANPAVKYKSVRAKENIKIRGEVRIVPMRGATVVISSPALGFVEIGKLLDLPSDVARRFEEIAKNRGSVQAEGILLTLCSDKELKEGVLGCRVFDVTQPVTVSPL